MDVMDVMGVMGVMDVMNVMNVMVVMGVMGVRAVPGVRMIHGKFPLSVTRRRQDQPSPRGRVKGRSVLRSGKGGKASAIPAAPSPIAREPR